MKQSNIGEIVADARKQCGFTQLQLADKINVSRSQIANVEIGRGYPSVQTIEEICEALGVELTCDAKGWSWDES